MTMTFISLHETHHTYPMWVQFLSCLLMRTELHPEKSCSGGPQDPRSCGKSHSGEDYSCDHLRATLWFYQCITDTQRHSFYHENPSTNSTKNKKQEPGVGTNCATWTPICIAGTIITLRRAQALGHPTGFQSLVYKVFWFAAVWLLWHFKRGRFERMLLLWRLGLGNGYWKITQENRRVPSLFFPPYMWMTSVLGKGAPGTDPGPGAPEGISKEQVQPRKQSRATWGCPTSHLGALSSGGKKWAMQAHWISGFPNKTASKSADTVTWTPLRTGLKATASSLQTGHKQASSWNGFGPWLKVI